MSANLAPLPLQMDASSVFPSGNPQSPEELICLNLSDALRIQVGMNAVAALLPGHVRHARISKLASGYAVRLHSMESIDREGEEESL